MPPEIRFVRPADIDAIHAIYSQAVLHGTASFELEPPGRAEMDRRVGSLVEAGFPFLVAQGDGECLGYAYAGPYRTRPAYRFTLEDSIYVAASARGRGVGGRLLSRLMEEATARGFRQMVAVIGDSANSASIAVHARAGFAPVGTIVAAGFKFGRWIDSVLMQAELGEGAHTLPAAPPIRSP